jgi:hypothetical protein
MKGIYDKAAIRSVVEPLKAISSVFSNTPVHVVYENSEDTMFISVVKKPKIYAIYELKAKEVIRDYEPCSAEVGIWDVNQFINILGKYENDVYVDDVIIECADNKLVLSCGNEETDYYTAQLHLFDDSRGKIRRLKTESLTEACKFNLSGAELKKLKMNISVFDIQDEVTFFGKKGQNSITARLSSSGGNVFNKNESKLNNVPVTADFNLKFLKQDIKGLLSCNDTFDFGVYVGQKNIISASYAKNAYTMNFYFAPIAE